MLMLATRAWRLFPALLAGLALAPPAYAQQSAAQPPETSQEAAATGQACLPGTLLVHGLADYSSDYLRVAELGGGAPLRSWLLQRPAAIRSSPYCAEDATSPWAARMALGRVDAQPLVAPLAAGGAMRFNSAYPRSRNDGALWAGRGINIGLHAGAELAYGPFTATIAPIIWWQENRSFAIRPQPFEQWSPYAYTGHLGTIDWPQRHGAYDFVTIDPGQSQISLQGAGVVTGFSTENIWWGPARRNPLLMSSTAPGVPRFFAGTSRPVNIWIGSLEADLFWGIARESDYFDHDPDNDRRLFSGIAIAFEPRWVPGLFLGAARAYMNTLPPGGIGVSEFLLRPYRGVRENPQAGELQDNQLASIFARWALPESGFEVYAEWGREDHWGDLTDLISQPDHSQAYMLGLQKVFTRERRWVRVAGELTHLQAAYPYRGGRYVQTWYVHTVAPQGYTHRGHLLGAPIGPGSDAQFIGVDVFDARGVIGGFVERTRYDDDAYYNNWGRFYGHNGQDVELTAGAQQVFFWRDLDASWKLSYSWRRNRNFVGLDGSNWDFPTATNIGLRLGLVWRPGLMRQ
jgi:hypothetical protein